MRFESLSGAGNKFISSDTDLLTLEALRSVTLEAMPESGERQSENTDIDTAIDFESSRDALDKEAGIFQFRYWAPAWEARVLFKLMHAGLPVCIVGDSDVVVNQALGIFQVDSKLKQ